MTLGGHLAMRSLSILSRKIGAVLQKIDIIILTRSKEKISHHNLACRILGGFTGAIVFMVSWKQSHEISSLAYEANFN